MQAFADIVTSAATGTGDYNAVFDELVASPASDEYPCVQVYERAAQYGSARDSYTFDGDETLRIAVMVRADQSTHAALVTLWKALVKACIDTDGSIALTEANQFDHQRGGEKTHMAILELARNHQFDVSS